MGIILETLFDLIMRDMSYFERLWNSIAFMAMVEEWPEDDDKGESIQDLLKDNA